MFRKSNEKSWISGSFSEAETEKNPKKIMLKYVRFLDIDFFAFFCDFWGFCWILGGPGPSKNLKKNLKIGFGTLLERVSDF